MRKENSTFNTAFVSHEGTKLFNNDYYGSAEVGKYACYVVADGLETGNKQSHSAKIAVEAAIAAFHEHPSMKPRMLRHYVSAAHRALKKNAGHFSLRSSITVVVTNYQAVRYAWAGNTRFYLYRIGRLLESSQDHSLAQSLTRKSQTPIDKIAKHEERGNLSRFLGQEGHLTPQVSKKIKLNNGDIFMLLSRGVWEHCQPSDIRAVLDSSENHPTLALEYLERFLLSPHPKDVDNYTAAIVFVDKVYVDPNRGKKIKRALAIAIPILLILIILSVVLLIMHNKREEKRHDMQTAFINAVEYVADENYLRADEEIKIAVGLSRELKDASFENQSGNWQKLIEAVQNGDDLLQAASYPDSEAAYLVAQNRSRFVDNAGAPYIDRKLTILAGLLSVRDLISLGDTLADSSEYIRAESKYLDAKRLASSINDSEGRQMALDALQALYEQQGRNESQSRDAAEQQAKTLQEAANMEAAGDAAVEIHDLISGKLYYIIARERFSDLQDETALARIDGKLASVQDKQSQNEAQASLAGDYVVSGDSLYDQKDFVGAKAKYILARSIYAQIKDDTALASVISKIELCDIALNEQIKAQAATVDVPDPPQQDDSEDTPDEGVK